MTSGQVAYEKWRELIDTPKAGNVAPVVKPWDELNARVKSIWETVAETAVQHRLNLEKKKT